MSGPVKSLRDIVENVESFLVEQKELFGDTIIPTGPPLTAGLPEDHPSQEFWPEAKTIGDLHDRIHTCLKCSLGHTRTSFVFGVGNPNADVMFIGEAPGADEDLRGEPFVGRAGQLLNKIIESVQLRREDVYICNILKCRPPNNRDPEPEEMRTCTPYLVKQIELVKPKFIICLGRIAAHWLLQTKETLGSLRERVHHVHGATLLVTYHPAALLRNPNWKRPTWEDMKRFRKLYDEELQR